PRPYCFAARKVVASAAAGRAHPIATSARVIIDTRLRTIPTAQGSPDDELQRSSEGRELQYCRADTPADLKPAPDPRSFFCLAQPLRATSAECTCSQTAAELGCPPSSQHGPVGDHSGTRGAPSTQAGHMRFICRHRLYCVLHRRRETIGYGLVAERDAADTLCVGTAS